MWLLPHIFCNEKHHRSHLCWHILIGFLNFGGSKNSVQKNVSVNNSSMFQYFTKSLVETVSKNSYTFFELKKYGLQRSTVSLNINVNYIHKGKVVWLNLIVHVCFDMTDNLIFLVKDFLLDSFLEPDTLLLTTFDCSFDPQERFPISYFPAASTLWLLLLSLI